MMRNIAFGFCGWDIVAAIVVAVVIAIIVMQRNQHKKRIKDVLDMQRAVQNEENWENPEKM